MTQAERRKFLIEFLLNEEPRYREMKIPAKEFEQKQLLRALMNVRSPKDISGDFLAVQDEYLACEIEEKGITDISELKPVEEGIYLWQGDITTLRCGAIVNAANSGMTGCYHPCHGCIDNAIHSFAGVQLRLECDKLMRDQGFPEPTGQAKITSAYNLPCDRVIHTVGPIVWGELRQEEEELLRSCYISCLEIAEENRVGSIAFCCISTGEFHFPNDRAAEIAVETVRNYKRDTKSRLEVIFNVFKSEDREIYEALLGVR